MNKSILNIIFWGGLNIFLISLRGWPLTWISVWTSATSFRSTPPSSCHPETSWSCSSTSRWKMTIHFTVSISRLWFCKYKQPCHLFSGEADIHSLHLSAFMLMVRSSLSHRLAPTCLSRTWSTRRWWWLSVWSMWTSSDISSTTCAGAKTPTSCSAGTGS